MHVLVDVTYLGLPLAEKAKLSALAEDSAYLEFPQPMPVGSEVLVVVEEGVRIPATVTEVHEHVVGVDRAAGMSIRPQLDAAARVWWKGRGATVPRRSRGSTAMDAEAGRAADVVPGILASPSAASLAPSTPALDSERRGESSTQVVVKDEAAASASHDEFTTTAVMPTVFPDGELPPDEEPSPPADAKAEPEPASAKGRARGKKRNRRR